MMAWVMVLGLMSLVNVTMVGATASLAGSIPDSSFLVILSRYLKKKAEPSLALLYPVEAASRLERLRRAISLASGGLAAAAAAASIWAFAQGWGLVGAAAVTLWVLAANLAFLAVPVGIWRRRVARMPDGVLDEAARKLYPHAENDQR
ncbi:MAG: hypothetical protein HPY75_12160 [Actinobacteria bacterium]|nr:hypothetical protein [Actinomycetota bacterium]